MLRKSYFPEWLARAVEDAVSATTRRDRNLLLNYILRSFMSADQCI